MYKGEEAKRILKQMLKSTLKEQQDKLGYTNIQVAQKMGTCSANVINMRNSNVSLLTLAKIVRAYPTLSFDKFLRKYNEIIDAKRAE